MAESSLPGFAQLEYWHHFTVTNSSYKLIFLSWTCTVSDNLARCGALESLVNEMADDPWDSKVLNRHSAIHFLDDDYDEDDEKVRLKLSKTPLGCWCNKLSCTLNMKFPQLETSSSKITMVANLFPSHRGHSFERPLLTLANWKQWRKQPRTSVTTWSLPKAWTPTKTRSITLQTEWPHLCDLLTSHVFTSRISRCCLAQTLLFPLLLLYLRLPTPVWPPPPFLLWDACKLPSSPALCRVWAAVPFTF